LLDGCGIAMAQCGFDGRKRKHAICVRRQFRVAGGLAPPGSDGLQQFEFGRGLIGNTRINQQAERLEIRQSCV
jgi:hypothetical protein